MEKNHLAPSSGNEELYILIRKVLNEAKQNISRTVNSTMVHAYWQVGKYIVEYEQQGKERAEYGKGVINELSNKLVDEFGNGFTITNLKYMRQLYLIFPIGHALRDQLSWTHYRSLLKVANKEARNFYIEDYLARCFVLIDLKTDELTHQDLGQMQMYVNYYTREMMNPDDNPPIGIVLCADKNDTVVKYTLPENNSQIFASKYMTYLPTEEELRKEFIKLNQ